MAGDITWISGKKGYARLRLNTDDNSEQYTWTPFYDWNFPISAAFLKRNCGRLDSVQGYQDGASGFYSGKPTIKGPWALEASPIVAGLFYDLLFGITTDGPLEYGCTAHASEVTPSDTAEDGPMINVTFDTVGPFDVASIGTDGALTT